MPVMLPPDSPNLNAYAERGVRSVKEQALSWSILFGERALWHTLNEYATHYHQERPHQSEDNVILMPRAPNPEAGPLDPVSSPARWALEIL
jgi:hypothetical protein